MQEFLQLFSFRDILLHVINTVILFVAIRFLVYKPVRKYLNARSERITAALDDAVAKQAAAGEALAGAQQTQKSMEADIARAQTQSAQQAQANGEALLDGARRQAEEILLKAQAEADRMKAAAQEEIQAQALSMAVEIAEKMIGRELAVRDNETLAREFLTKVG